MKLGIRILVSFLLIFVGAFYYLTDGFLKDIRYRYLEGVEDVLVDKARILATIVSQDMQAGRFSAGRMRRVFNAAHASRFSAQIYQLTKTGVDLRVYMTDENGIVIFDSRSNSTLGADYSNWRDVYLTLRGKYGARSSDEDPKDPASNSLYVAAPIMVNDKIAGVLTVCKPTTNINDFLKIAKDRVLRKSVFAGICVVLLSTAVLVFIVRPIKLLTRYADDVRQGKKTALPKLGRSEIGDMGRAFEKMRDALEGKKYVENYIQTLTHEIKSPISAIQGASELLEEDMPRAQKTRFLTNIRKESNRIRQLVERMLHLSSLENMNIIEQPESVAFNRLVEAVIERFNPMIAQKSLELKVPGAEVIHLAGDAFLLKQAISNLIQNAIDFSPARGQISIFMKQGNERLAFVVEDQGPGMPDFAMDRVFQKFFSLQRPVSGEKGTGLGLNFVKKIAELHNGTIRLENRSPHGVRAILSLPLSSP